MYLLVGDEKEIVRIGVRYLHIVFLTFPFCVSLYLLTNFLRVLEPSFLYGGYPCKDLRHMFLPIIAFCGRTPGFFMGGSVIAFVLGYCSMFFKSGLLRKVYPFLASFTVIGFDTTSYISAKSKASVPLGLASLGAMLLISAFIIVISITPGEAKTKHKKNNISLRPAQRERIKTNRY